jgi:hypothetical protein
MSYATAAYELGQSAGNPTYALYDGAYNTNSPQLSVSPFPSPSERRNRTALPFASQHRPPDISSRLNRPPADVESARRFSEDKKIPPLIQQTLRELRKLNVKRLTPWISKLSTIEIKNRHLADSVYTQIADVLLAAENDPSLEAVLYNITDESTETCDDRVALSVIYIGLQHSLAAFGPPPDCVRNPVLRLSTPEQNKLECDAPLIDVRTEKTDENVEDGTEKTDENVYERERTSRCRAMYRVLINGLFTIDLLYNLARYKVAGLPDVDELEVYLGYLIKLKEDLDIPINLDNMVFFNLSCITSEDLKSAKEHVLSQRSSVESCHRFLVQQDIWMDMLKRYCSKSVDTILKKRGADDDYVNAYNTYMQEIVDTSVQFMSKLE